MRELIQNLDWIQVISVVWTVILLPVITYTWNQFYDYAKEKKLDGYAKILKEKVVDAVKDVYETVVKDIKNKPKWTEEKQKEVRELAKSKAINALTMTMYEALKRANSDFEDYLDGLVGTALYDLKHSDEKVSNR